MTSDPASQTRRSVLSGAFAAATCATALGAAPAHAATRLGYPLGLLYARIGPDGFERIDSDEQALWSSMSLRLGALISRIEPIQRYSMLTNNPPSTDSETGSVLIARQLASDAGLDHVLLYSSHDGTRTYTTYSNWLAKAYAGLRTTLGPREDAIAEAHILSVHGGPPLISLSLDAPARSRLNPHALRPDPHQQAMTRLADAIEADIRADASDAFRAQASIAD